MTDSIELLESQASPRFIKTHLPVQLLPDQIWTVKPKLIYIKRNPKAVAVSYFHHNRLLYKYRGSMEEYIAAFVKDVQLFSPYFPHIDGYCRLSNLAENLLILNYEDMKKDLRGVIEIVAEYLEISVDSAMMEKLCDHLSFNGMKSMMKISTEYQVKF